MTHALFATFGAFAVAGTLTVAAQTPTPSAPRPQTPTPSPSTPARTDDKTITVTGCLKAWDASMEPGRSGSTPPATAAADRFVLSNVASDGGMTRPPAGAATSGTPSPEAGGHSMGAKDDTQYVLTADSGVNLAAHLNHQVRVTGKVTERAHPAAARGTGAPGATSPRPDPSRPGETPRTGDRMGMDTARSTIAVSSVTMISNSCTGATR